MIPANVRGPGRMELPVWLIAVAIVVVLLAGFCGWVLVGMGSAPAQSTVTADVPLAR